MNRFLKILAVIFAGAGIVVIAVLVAAKFIITPERVRRAVIPRAESALNRPVSIGDIRVNIFSGIDIKNFSVKTESGEEIFVAADSLVLRYQFWPLLRMRVVLDEALLENPEIRLVRFENGEFNFSDLLGPGAEPESQPAPEPDSGPPIDLVVNEMRISGGRLNYIDRFAGPDARQYQLTHLDVSADEISFNQAFPFSFDAQLNGAPISISGNFNPETLTGNAKITARKIDVSRFDPYIAGRIPGKIESMMLDFDINATRKGHIITSSGDIRASQVNMVLDAMPDAPLKDARAAFSFEGGADLANKIITIKKAKADVNGISVLMEGTVESYDTRPMLDLRASLPPTGTEAFLAALPRGMVEQADQMNPEGRISADVQLAGPTDQVQTLVRQGEIRLDAVRATYNGLRAGIDGRIGIKGDSVSGKGITIGMDEQKAMLDFEAANLTGDPVRLTHVLNSDALDLDKIMASMAAEEKAPPGEVETGEKTEEAEEAPSGPMDLPLIADGTVRVKSAIYQGLPVEDFTLLYRLENNILNVNEISGQVAGGSISGKGRINLGQEKAGYDADVSLEGTRTDDLVSALFPKAAKTVFGSLFLNAGLSGNGLDLSAIRQSLTGQADLKMTDGRLTGMGLTRGLAAFLDAEALEVLDFDTVQGKVRLNRGKFDINTNYNSSDLRMSPTGTIGLDGSVSLSLNMRLAPDLASRINGSQGVSQVLTDDQGWTLVPLNVAGSFASPRFSLDTAAIQQQVKEKGTRELRRKIEEELFGKPVPGEGGKPSPGEKPPPAEPEGKQPPVDKMLEDTLRKIF